ncbi:hypothetical protein ANO11243_061690 [Dothideomycetidae sp. 11243]|nr:hypothetical protein ANO11243_061690 [fungal sp. No.11243]
MQARLLLLLFFGTTALGAEYLPCTVAAAPSPLCCANFDEGVGQDCDPRKPPREISDHHAAPTTVFATSSKRRKSKPDSEANMARSLFSVGQSLRGRLGRYVITEKIQDTVWFAEYVIIPRRPVSFASLIMLRNQSSRTVVVKAVLRHPRVRNERDMLRLYQDRSPHIRPLVDEIQPPHDYPTIVLRHLDDHLLNASIKKTLTARELRHVARGVLEGLAVLHADGVVHTGESDIKPDNILVNKRNEDARFSEVQLGDLGGACAETSEWAKKGIPVGAPMWSSPEVIMETPWSTATDIWSFGAMIISLVLGGNICLFRPPAVPYGHEEYSLEVLKQQFRYFGPFPPKYEEIASPETITAILWLMDEIPCAKTTPFANVAERQISRKDKEFVGKIMKLDWRERQTAKELLKDPWFTED